MEIANPQNEGSGGHTLGWTFSSRNYFNLRFIREFCLVVKWIKPLQVGSLSIRQTLIREWGIGGVSPQNLIQLAEMQERLLRRGVMEKEWVWGGDCVPQHSWQCC